MFTVKQPYHTNEFIFSFADDQTRNEAEKKTGNHRNHREDESQNGNGQFVENISSGDETVGGPGHQKETEDKSQMVLGIVVGAGVVIFVLACVLVGYRVWWSKRRRRDSKKYQYQQPGHPGIPSQVTLLPIQSVAATRGHSRMDLSAQGVERGQLTRLVAPLNRDERARGRPGAQGQGQSQFDLRSPPPYNESFLDNGGSVVAV